MLFPPFLPMFKVNKLAKHSSNQAKCRSEREVETQRGMKETCRQTDRQRFYLLMCLMVQFDSKVYFRVLSLKPGPGISVLNNWTWWLKCCWLTNSPGPVLSRFIFHSNHWMLSISPSLFKSADRWSTAVIQSFSSLPGNSWDSFLVMNLVRSLFHCRPELRDFLCETQCCLVR